MGLLLFVLSYICSFFSLSRFFVKDISTTVLDRNFNFGTEVRIDKLYCGIANGHSPIFCIQVDSDKLYNGIEMFVPSCIRSLFFLSYIQYCSFSYKIFQQLFNIEGAYLLYEISVICCILG